MFSTYISSEEEIFFHSFHKLPLTHKFEFDSGIETQRDLPNNDRDTNFHDLLHNF